VTGGQPLGDSPASLLDAARQLLEHPDVATAGLWPRAAAILARQALEATVARYWQDRGLPTVASASTRSQLICLAELAGPEVAGPASFIWATLSGACHARAYELAPTASELRGWIDTAQALSHRMAAMADDGVTPVPAASS
jgi:hypothetical protein